MKAGFIRSFSAVACTILLSACGQPKTASSTLSKTSDECAGSAMPRQFIAQSYDGHMEVVQAESEQAFIDGYLTKNLDRIKYAEHDYFVSTELPVQALNDGVVSTADNWGPAKINADKLWAQNIRGAGIVVAVVDTGMDVTHSQLVNQVLVNPGESGLDSRGKDKASNNTDDDGNGYIDDTYGFNFVSNRPLAGDNAYHGTHVSGIIGAEHSDVASKTNTSYVEGIAPGAKILPLAFLDDKGSGSMSDGVRAIKYAVSRGARVINASWGGTQCSESLKDVIQSLEGKGIAFIAAAGNDSSNIDRYMEYPASLNLLAQITVGATGDHDYMAQYSNYGAQAVHIFAPGTDIISLYPGNRMLSLSGTSMATPFVSGAVALLFSALPEATVDQVRHALYNSAMRNPQYINASSGRLDLSQAMAELHRILGH